MSGTRHCKKLGPSMFLWFRLSTSRLRSDPVPSGRRTAPLQEAYQPNVINCRLKQTWPLTNDGIAAVAYGKRPSGWDCVVDADAEPDVRLRWNV